MNRLFFDLVYDPLPHSKSVWPGVLAVIAVVAVVAAAAVFLILRILKKRRDRK